MLGLYFQQLKSITHFYELINSYLLSLQQSFDYSARQYYNPQTKEQNAIVLYEQFYDSTKQSMGRLVQEITSFLDEQRNKNYVTRVKRDVNYKEKVGDESIANLFDWSTNIHSIKEGLEVYAKSIKEQIALQQSKILLFQEPSQMYMSKAPIIPLQIQSSAILIQPQKQVMIQDDVYKLSSQILVRQSQQRLHQSSNLVNQTATVLIQQIKVQQQLLEPIIQNEPELRSKINQQQASSIDRGHIHTFHKENIEQAKPQLCKTHYLHAWYLCPLQTQKNICNMCIMDDKHQNHRVLCKEHHFPIKFKRVVKSQQYENEQIYFCEKCPKSSMLQKVYPISQCHFQIIKVCLDDEKIKNDQFLICPRCQDPNIISLPFDRDYLKKYFQINQQDLNISLYEDLYIQIREKLKLSFMNKVMLTYLKGSWNIFSKLDSFLLNRDIQISQWVQMFILNKSKQFLYVLKEVKDQQMNETKRFEILQTVRDYISIQLQSFYTQVSLFLSNFRKRQEPLYFQDQQQLSSLLLSKYQTIVNIENASLCEYRPNNLYQIPLNHLHRVSRIIIEKSCQDLQDEMAQNKRKQSRYKFYCFHLRNKINSSEIPQQTKQKICELFVSDSYAKYSNSDELNQHKYIIEQLIQLYQSIQKQYQQQSKVFKPLKHILSNKFANLKTIRITYTLEKSWSEYKYSASSFRAFQLIHLNPKIEDILIDGVQITEFDLFIKYLRISNLGKIQRSSGTLFDYNGQQLLFSGQKWKTQSKWLKHFIPSQTIRLFLHAQLYYFLSKSIVKDLIEDLRYFLKVIPLISNIKFVFDMKWYQTISEPLFNLLDLIDGLKSVRINISNYRIMQFDEKADPFTVTLLRLSNLLTINNLQLSYVTFDDQLKVDQFLNITQTFAKIFQRNTITQLKLVECKQFPILPTINTLKSIIVNETTFKNFNQSQQRNQTHSITSLTLLNNNNANCKFALDELSTLYIDNINFFNNLNDYTGTNLKLKHIFLWNKRNFVQTNSFKQIFPRLTQLNTLYLNDINFNYEFLKLIPSLEVTQLSFRKCKQINEENVKFIDSKWPYLKKLVIVQCVSKWENGQRYRKIIRSCSFKGLIELKIDNQINSHCQKDVRILKKKGIKVIVVQQLVMNQLLSEVQSMANVVQYQ